MDFTQSEGETAVARVAREFAEREMRPVVMQYDESQEFPDAIVGPRKTFVSFSRTIQFAGILPAAKGSGSAELGLPLPLSESKRLTPMKKRPWAEKHSAILVLSAPKEVDGEVKRLLKLAYAKG